MTEIMKPLGEFLSAPDKHDQCHLRSYAHHHYIMPHLYLYHILQNSENQNFITNQFEAHNNLESIKNPYCDKNSMHDRSKYFLKDFNKHS